MDFRDVLFSPGWGAYYVEDIAALQREPLSPSKRYHAPSQQPGLRHVRQIAEVLSVGLMSEDEVFWGDCLGVSYGGKAGRDEVFTAAAAERELRSQPELLQNLGKGFKVDCAGLNVFSKAVQFGLSQSLLRAYARQSRKSLTRFLCDEWHLPIPEKRVPLHGSCGHDWYDNVDKMLCYGLPSLPAGQGDDIPARIGTKGERLLEYVDWLKRRVRDFSAPMPVFHFDLHGALGIVFDQNGEALVDYIAALEIECAPFSLRLESPVQKETREAQIEAYAYIRGALRDRGLTTQLVADEWANTLEDIQAFCQAEAVDMIHIKMPDLGSLAASMEAVLSCHDHAVQTLLGGSCVETSLSSELAIPIALSSRPTLLMAKSGMGVNEAVSFFNNAMARELLLLERL